MTKSQIENAIQAGVPFTVRMADGMAYEVPYRDYISLPPKNATIAVVYDNQGSAHVLPLLTMTGISYKSKDEAAVESPA